MTNRPAKTAAVLLAASTSLLAAVAHADITNHSYTNSSNYHYRVTKMPDLDQVRDSCCNGLPNDGLMYCVPTGTFNLFCYAANHGFPWVAAGPRNWSSQANYSTASFWINALGILMSTDPYDGTGGGWADGTYDFMASNAAFLTASFYYLSDDYTPRAFKISKKACDGSIVAFVYGRYNVTGQYNGVPLVQRTGGHCVTLNEAIATNGNVVLRYRDPADVPVNTIQDPFATKEVTATAVNLAFNTDSSWVRTVTAIAYPSSDGKIRLIDGYVVVRPLFLLTFQNTGPDYSMIKVPAYALDGLGGGSVNLNSLGQIFGVSDLLQDLDGDDALAIVNIGAAAPVTQLRRIDTVTGEQTPLGGITNPKRFTVGRDGRIYVHDGSKLYCLKPDGTLEGASSNVPLPTSLAYDDATDEVIVYSIGAKRITRLSKSLQVNDIWTIPANYELAGDGSVTVNPVDGSVWFDSDATDNLHRAVKLTDGQAATFSTFPVPGVVDPKGLSSSDDGTIYVSTPAGLKPVKQNRAGGFTVDPTNPFLNKPVAGRVAMLRSRSNFDPALHTGPAWNNILPSELLPIGTLVPDCDADLDGDNLVGPADLARLLGNWGSTGGSSDLDDDGTVGQADLAILLGQWGACS